MSNNYNNNKQYTPKSGATLHQKYGSKEGLFMTCWKIQDGVMWKGKIFRSEKQAKEAPTLSRNNKEWVSVTIVLDAPFKETLIINALMNIENHKVYLKRWNYMINPKAANGGYFGKHITK